MEAAAWICLASPLAAATLIALLGTRISRRASGYLATASVALSFGAALVCFLSLLGRDAEERSELVPGWTWLGAGELSFGFELLIDPLSVFMMLIVSGVGALIVAYSIGYMDAGDEERRFFAYMALFVFSMLLLVMGGNLLLLLAGWGMVGLCSYLLIGYNQERPAAIAAAKKAFVMNAFGDATMALALFVLIQKTGSLAYGDVFGQADAIGSTAINLVALGLLGGAVAKSAQIPLQTWLPDAMEGPTPVSALIHAATMVTAGVYLLVRCHPLFEAAPRVQDLAAGLGAATLLVAGLIALVQVDIKRVIAYSTMSQIGYMFLGAGIGAYANGMFHLMTHAFFKALLFLGAGIAIHALAGEQDIRRMGGLRKLMPGTWRAMLVGSLALAGIFPLSGFWSKDSILASALAAGTYGVVLWVVGLVGAFLTGLYTFRMLFVAFGGEPSPYAREHYHDHHGREGPRWMLVPVGVLAILAVIGGWVQLAGVERFHWVSDWLHPVAEPLVEPSLAQDVLTSVIAVGLALAGIALAWWIYGARRLAAPSAAGLRRPLERKLYFDDLYDAVFYRPAAWIAAAWARYVEGPLVGGSVAGIALGTRLGGGGIARAQSGFLRTYVLALAAAIAVLTLVFVSAR